MVAAEAGKLKRLLLHKQTRNVGKALTKIVRLRQRLLWSHKLVFLIALFQPHRQNSDQLEFSCKTFVTFVFLTDDDVFRYGYYSCFK